MAFLGDTVNADDSFPLYVATYTQKGNQFTWSDKAKVTNAAYTPCFSVYNDQLYLFSIDTNLRECFVEVS
jgi:hypothetical protein